MAKEKRELVHRSYSQSGGSKVADHGSRTGFQGFFEFQGEREKGKRFGMRELQKSLSAQIQRHYEDAPFAAYGSAITGKPQIYNFLVTKG